ncbi:hypothetical protein FGB62_75g020 [Gracilaria domingensis]|nr:hypothetical protein FGB62_75g020 [Gracilaria domingensis]
MQQLFRAPSCRAATAVLVPTNDAIIVNKMKRATVRIQNLIDIDQNLIDIDEEEKYLLAEDDDDEWGTLDQTQPPETREPVVEEQEPEEPMPTVVKKSSKSTKQKGRSPNSWNYGVKDVNTLLDIIKEHEPTKMNGWARVHHDYNRYAQECDRPRRQSEDLKKKYDKLIYVQKRTGDPTCPAFVLRAKNIQSQILAKMVSLTYNTNMDDGISPEGGEKLNEPQSTEAPRANPGKVLQLKRQLRTPFESPTKRRESEHMQCMKELTKSMTNLANVQLRRERLQTTAENNIDSIVKKVVEQSRDSIQAMVSSSIKDTLNEVFSKSRE